MLTSADLTLDCLVGTAAAEMIPAPTTSTTQHLLMTTLTRNFSQVLLILLVVVRLSICIER